MRKIVLAVLLTASCCGVAANPEPIIFGTVIGTNGQTYTGSIRWGDQETFLSDIFNGRKIATVGIEQLSDDEKSDLTDHQPGPKATMGDLQITLKPIFGKKIELPYFNVPFGSVRLLEIDNKKNLFTATLHDGSSIVSDGSSSNDLSSDVFVKNLQGETKEFELNELALITFAKAPAAALPFGDGIYGTVTSTIGTFEGRVMWDKDERLTYEELDGEDESQDYEIPFSDIKSIEKNGTFSIVILRNETTLNLAGTNDVNNGNRGIWVDHPDLGRVEIEWSQFKKLVIEDVSVNWLDFDDYASITKLLKGQVELKDGSTLEADSITYDMNQQSSSELIDVDVNEANREIPFRIIQQINVKNEQAVELLLQDQTTILAYGNRSVTKENNGILIRSQGAYRWIPWEQVQAVTFK
jgi:sporulation protein YlmC with PRC-barrel domain